MEWDRDFKDRFEVLPVTKKRIFDTGEDVEVAASAYGEEAQDDGSLPCLAINFRLTKCQHTGSVIHGRALTLAFARQVTDLHRCSINGNLHQMKECVLHYGMDVDERDLMVPFRLT